MTTPSTGSHPTLPPLWDPLVRAFIEDSHALSRVLGECGSPVHLVFPEVFAANIGRLRSVLDGSGVSWRMCYAHKANRSSAFVRTAAAAGIGVDIASAGELESAREAGFPVELVEATGPKGMRFLRELADSGVTVNVDNLWELETLAGLVGTDSPAPVLVRLCGFPGSPTSRFGIPIGQFDLVLDLLARHRGTLDFRGVAFHLDTGETAERMRAIECCLELLERAWEHGLRPSVLNIGGGLRQVFTADAGRFDDYVRALRDSLVGQGPVMSWGSNTFGYQVDGSGIRGTPVFHKYANTLAAETMLADLLAAPLERHGGRPFARVTADNLLEVWLEPGKALADHAGITVARVEFIKEAADGSTLVAVDLSRDTVTPADQEVMVDPLLLAGDGGPPAAEPAGVYLAGRLCLERDLVTARIVWLPWLPRPGDVLVFPNTGAYHMDLSAATAAHHPLPPKVAVDRRGDGWTTAPDEDYRPPRSTAEPTAASNPARSRDALPAHHRTDR